MDYREIRRLAGDSAGVRKIAKLLLTAPGLTERQVDFLSDMAVFEGAISTRQGETLLGIRDDLTEVSTVYGFSVPSLIRQCYEARFDLSEEDEAFIEGLRGRSKLRRKHAGRLLRCARKLELIQ